LLSDFSGGAYDWLFCGPFGICGDNIAFTGVANPDGTWNVEVSIGFIFAESVWTKQ
jgi:hypothetical protein